MTQYAMILMTYTLVKSIMKSIVLALVALLSLFSLSEARKSAALIIGGFDDNGGSVLSSVELFGCQGDKTIDVGNYPDLIYLGAGMTVNDNKIREIYKWHVT